MLNRPNFTIPESPVYTEKIPMLMPGDKAHANETFNQWIQPVVNNAAAAMQTARKAGVRRLEEGVDYTLELGRTKEDVNYAEQNHSYSLNGNVNVSSQVGDSVGQGAAFLNHWPRQRICPQDLSGAFNLWLSNWSGLQINMTVTDTENIYCTDETTIRTIIVTAVGQHDGITLELKMAIGFDIRNPNEQSYIDQIYFNVAIKEINEGALALNSSFGFNLVSFTLPPITATYEREYGALITLKDEFEVPEQLSAKIRLHYINEQTRTSGTVITSQTINPHIIEDYANFALDEKVEVGMDYCFNTILQAGKNALVGAWLEYTRAALKRKVMFLFPQWNWRCRVTRFELLELYKKFEV